MLSLIAAMIVLDQALKWWAWRYAPSAEINSGGDLLVGPTISAWYAGPVTGALLDLLDVGLLGAAVFVLARCRATAAVNALGALMVGGWGYNVADFFIIGCTPLFLLTAGYEGARAAMRPAGSVASSARSRVRTRMRIPALVGADLIVVVAFGAANYGGVNAASRAGGLAHGAGRCAAARC